MNPGNITTTYNIGNGITGICGVLYFYAPGGYLEFQPTSDPGPATSTGNTLIPQEVPLVDFENNFDDYRYELVKFNGVTFDDGGSNFSQGTNYPIQDASSNTGNFYTNDWNADYIGEPIPTQMQNIVGVAMVRTSGSLKYIVARDSDDFSTVYPMPLSSTGIFIGIGLLLTFLIVRFRRFIFQQ